ncbi:tail fiber assembly protein [Limnobaculum xujianqingii]|uniref:tail fiber assembly protein n=1 Tax=Limnobaculum xujianqingii TaxID=2738837 RepID=UPI001126BF46|nr:tail fiber assembly protein [Limnobaculum xujianqingii]
MSSYIYSAINNSFYPTELKESYVNSEHGWPSDGVSVSDDTYQLYTDIPPAGMMRVAGNDGLPMWVDVPEPTLAELVAIADNEKLMRLARANEKIAPLIDAVELSIATDEEEIQLAAWKKYRVLLTRVDTATAPDIDWPDQP